MGEFINEYYGIKKITLKFNIMEFTKINIDLNGNPRYVVHFLAFIPKDKTCQDFGGVTKAYKLACKAANKIGGRRYHTKNYGGGIVFQTYNTDFTKKEILSNQI